MLADIAHQQLISVQLLRQQDFESQVNASIQLIQSTARARTRSLVDFVQITSRSNTLVSSLMTNAFLSLKRGVHDHDVLQMVATYYYTHNYFNSSSMFSKSCSDEGLVTPAAFYSTPIATGLNTQLWPEAPIVGTIVPEASINGFFSGCTPLDALLASTLECLYQSTCLQTWRQYFPGLNQVCISCPQPFNHTR